MLEIAEDDNEVVHDDSAWDIGHEDNCKSMETHRDSLDAEEVRMKATLDAYE